MILTFFLNSSNRIHHCSSVTLTKRFDQGWGHVGGVLAPHDTHVGCEKSLYHVKNTKKPTSKKSKQK